MLENAFNGIVSKSLNNLEGSFGYKIPDTFSAVGTRSTAPFDGFGLYKSKDGVGYPIYWESKSLSEPKAFPLTRLEDHQIEALLTFYNTLGDSALSLFLVCVDFGRNDKRVFVWKNKDLLQINERKINKKNLLKKEFESLTNYVKIEKGYIDFEKILNM